MIDAFVERYNLTRFNDVTTEAKDRKFTNPRLKKPQLELQINNSADTDSINRLDSLA